MAEHATVVDVSRYYPAAGKREELIQAMHRLAQQAASSPGCFGAQVCVSDAEPEALVAVSRWESKEALQGFSEAQSFVAERETLASLLAKPAAREHLKSA